MSGDYVSSPIDDAISRLFVISRDEHGRFIYGDEDDLYGRLDPNRPKDVRDDV